MQGWAADSEKEGGEGWHEKLLNNTKEKGLVVHTYFMLSEIKILESSIPKSIIAIETVI